MEIMSMQMNLNTNNMFRCQKPYNINKVKAICSPDSLAMHRSGKTNFYKVLSLDSENVGLAEIKKAYRSLVLEYHPDVCPPSAKEESTKRFLELQMAYETLADPVSRQMYDLGLGYGSSLMDQERRSNFPRDIWEKQLDGLKKRSNIRMQRMKNRYSASRSGRRN